MSKYVLSTMANSVGYAFYHNVGGVPMLRKKVQIHGGANMPSTKSGFGEMVQDGEGKPMWVAGGIVTPVSDADFESLEAHPLFQKHLKKGFLKVINQDITGNHKAVQKHIVTMNQNDEYGLMDSSRLGGQVKTETVKLSQEQQYLI